MCIFVQVTSYTLCSTLYIRIYAIYEAVATYMHVRTYMYNEIVKVYKVTLGEGGLTLLNMHVNFFGM